MRPVSGRTCLFFFVSVCAVLRAETVEERWAKLEAEGTRLRESGDYSGARHVYDQGLADAQQLGGDRLAQSLNNLGVACYDLADYRAAEEHYRRAIEIWQARSSPSDLASVWSNLAEVYGATGRTADAESLFRKAIDLAGAAKDEKLRIDFTNNLAELLLKQNRPHEAESLLTGILTGLETKPEPPALPLVLNNLATAQKQEGRYGEAEAGYRRVLEIEERQLGPDHPSTATTLNNLASLYHAQGRDTEAVPLLFRSIGIGEKTLGPAHPQMATRYLNLGSALAALGRFDSAESEYRKALDICQR